MMTVSDAISTFGKIAQLKAENIPFVLCTIIAKHGSAPRDPGTHMIVTEYDMYGTVGGGVSEYKAINHARSILENDGDDVSFCDYDLGLSAPNAEKTDMLCAGLITVMFTRDRLFPDPGEGIVYTDNGSKLYFVFEIESNEGYQIFTDDTLPDSIRSISGMFHFDGSTVIEPVGAKPRIFIFGAGHVGCAVARIMTFLGYEVIAADDRPDIINGRIGEIGVNAALVRWDKLEEYLDLNPSDYAVIMTNEHVNDIYALTYALDRKAFYIGCMGSKARSAANRKELIRMGYSDIEAEQIHMPIGLPIGGRSPEEIALSVAAEITSIRYKKEML